MILHYFNKKENIEKKISEEIYKGILRESNLILINNNFFKEKNYNSSFEIVSILIIFYIKNNIKNNIKNYNKINEYLISIFIDDLDESLRKKGIGDMSIGKYVKSYVKKFYYRLSQFPNISEINSSNFLENYLQLFDFIKDNKISLASNKFKKIYTDIENSAFLKD